jgi:hypothetical protein
MPTDGRWEKCMIETGAATPRRLGGVARSSTGTEAWSLWFPITARAIERYKSLDKNVEFRVQFRSHHTLSLEETRIVRLSDGGRIYEPVASPEAIRLAGKTSLLVREVRQKIQYGAAEVDATPSVAATGVTV